jgi:hypothetical protein
MDQYSPLLPAPILIQSGSIKLTMTLTDLSGGTVNVETVLMTCSKQNTSYNVQNLVIKFYFKLAVIQLCNMNAFFPLILL